MNPRLPTVERTVQARFAVLAMLCCQACSTPPLESAVSLPEHFEQGQGAAVLWPAADWYRTFSSPELNALIELARQNNLDLAAAQARIRQADARARAAGAAILPQVDAGANVAGFNGRSHGASAHETDWSVLLSAAYEVDFWGRNSAAASATRYSAVAARSDRDALALTTTAGVANTYFQVLSLRERLSLAQANVRSAREVLEIIQARFDAGAATAVELAAQRAAVANAELTIAPLQQQEMETLGALALLVGRAPESFVIEARQLDGLIEPDVAPGLPVDLLTRRPDLAVAEANLQSAHADLAAARAALLPALTLTAGGGVQNPAVQAAVITLTGTGPAVTVGASLLQSIFDGGRRRAQRDEAQGREMELLANYRGAILGALLDVEAALSAIQHLDSQRSAQLENVSQSGRAFEGARLRYVAGSGDYLSVLEAQRSLYSAREQMSQYKLARLQASVSLCKALGGGWAASDGRASR